MRVVLTAAIMDLCHAGHLKLLRELRKHGEKLIVVLHDDASAFRIKDKIPIQNIQQRVRNLEITGLVDEVLITKSIDPSDKFKEVIDKYDNILFMRADDNKEFPGKWMIEEYSIPIKYVPYTEGISTTQIKTKLCSTEKYP